ncbi:MAG: hypothetical protein ACTSX9_09570 [Candidatus Njordarchaeales archaeon]
MSISLIDYLEDKIRRYLGELMRKDFEYDEVRRVFIVRERIDNKLSWKIFVNVTEKWIFIYAPILKVGDLRDDIKMKLFEILLWLNNEYADTSFQYDKMRDVILVSNEIHADGFVYDVFEEQYEAIVNSIKIFLGEGLPDLKEYMADLREKALEALNI